MPAATLWGLPAIPSKMMPQGQGARRRLLQRHAAVRPRGRERQGQRQRSGRHVHNRATMLGEGRFGLAVWRPSAFAVVD